MSLRKILLFAILSVISVNILLLYHFFTDGRSSNFDWRYFESISLVLRSNLLSYKTWPLHNPWICGGIDISANPNYHNFSPRLLLDLFFKPYASNILTLLIYGCVGFIGAYFWFYRFLENQMLSLVGSLLFLSSSFFGLHFTVGHIPYAGLQLIPLFLYASEKILYSARSFFWFIMGLSFLILDSQIYPFIFISMILIFYWPLMTPMKDIKRYLLHDKTVRILSLLILFMVALVKYIPTKMSFQIVPVLDYFQIPWSSLGNIFFNPMPDFLHYRPWKWDHYEYLCYFGILGISLALIGLRWSNKVSFMYWSLFLFFLWVGIGCFPSINPWNLFQKIPVFNNAHIQSRVFIIAHLMLIMLILISVKNFPRKLAISVVILLIGEALFVRNYPIRQVSKTPIFEAPSIITSQTIITTVMDSNVPGHYTGRQGSVKCFDSLKYKTSVSSKGNPLYQGEIYLSAGEGKVFLSEYTPGHIKFKYACAEPCRVEFNTNYLLGWKSSSSKFQPSESYGLLGVDLPAGTVNEDIELSYSPKHLPYILGLLSLSLVLFFSLIGYLYRPYFQSKI